MLRDKRRFAGDRNQCQSMS